jgi:hypothetical protein
MAYVTLTTDAKNFHQHPTIAMSATSAVPVRLTATKPVSNSTANVVFGSSLNYMKFKFYTDVSQTTNIAIYGWNHVAEPDTYVPQLLVLLGGTNTTASAAIPGIGTVFEITSWTPSQGDSKNYNGTTTTTPGGFILVDTLGCEYIEVRPYAAASANVTVLAAGL